MFFSDTFTLHFLIVSVQLGSFLQIVRTYFSGFLADTLHCCNGIAFPVPFSALPILCLTADSYYFHYFPPTRATIPPVPPFCLHDDATTPPTWGVCTHTHTCTRAHRHALKIRVLAPRHSPRRANHCLRDSPSLVTSAGGGHTVLHCPQPRYRHPVVLFSLPQITNRGTKGERHFTRQAIYIPFFVNTL